MIRHPLIKSQAASIGLGIVLVLVGYLVLYGAWEGRGGKKPWFLGPFLPW